VIGDLDGSAWSEVLSAALLGTDRRPWSGATVPGLPELPAGPEGLLQGAAMLTTWREAGRTVAPPPFSPPLRPTADPRPVLGQEPRRLLATLIRDRRQAAILDEWLDRAAASGSRLPGALLADLVPFVGLDDEARLGRLRTLGGPLLAWLAALNPDWAPLARFDGTELSLDQWSEASDEARLALFRRFRADDPAGSAALLAEVLPGEPAASAVALTQSLSEQLSDVDIELLESALDDRRKRVRAVSMELLGRLPTSPRAQRLADLAVPAISVTGRWKHTLTVGELPPADDAQERDGVVGSSSERFGVAVSGAALDSWTVRLGHSPADLVSWARASSDPKAGALLVAWAMAARRQRDRIWVGALLDAGVSPDGGLLSVLDPVDADRRLAGAVSAAELGSLPALIGACTDPWGPQASSAAIATISRIVGRIDLSKGPDAALTHAAQALQSSLVPLALRLDPRTDATPLVEGVSDAPSPAFWLGAVAGSGSALGLAGILAFRAALAAAFEPMPTSATPLRSLS
jgi:hypothetical protein